MPCICLARRRNQVREPRRRRHAPARMRNARGTRVPTSTGNERRLGLNRSQPMRPAHPAAARIVRGGGFATVADGKEIR